MVQCIAIAALGSMVSCAILAGLCAAQAPAKPLTFDVASVKPAKVPDGVTISGGKTMVRKGAGIQIPRNTGGPGTDDPGRIHYPYISLTSLLKKAWDSYYEIKGSSWLDDQIVAVDATMPTDTTKEHFQEMLRNLIVDRFGLKYHAETREVTGYALVLIKGGPKMTESPNQNEARAEGPPPRPTSRSPEGFPILPPRPGPWLVSMSTEGKRSRIFAQLQTMTDLAQNLARGLGAIVTDATGLTAKYDFILTYAGGMEPGSALSSSLPAALPDAADPLPDLFTALQSQLGLKLESKKVPVDVMVIDHMEKTPTGN